MSYTKRLIDAKSLERQIKNAFSKDNPYLMGQMLRWIRMQAKVDAVEVVHAKWLKNGWNDYSCSACRCNLIGHGASGWNYCPNCGAKMDGGNEDV